MNYNLVAQTPQYSDADRCRTCKNIPITRRGMHQPEILARRRVDFARRARWQSISHYNIRRVLDIYAAVQDRDLGGVGRDIQRIVDANRASAAARQFRHMCAGRWKRCGPLISDCWPGSAFAIVLVYLLIVVNFQSWLDPFIIITALPAALAGIVLFLFLTHTTLSVPR